MQLPSILTMLMLIGASSPLNLRLPASSPPSNPGSLNAVAGPPRLWPKVPWKLTGLFNGGSVWFKEYGRRLSFDTETERQINEDSGRIAQALRLYYHPESETQASWWCNRGVVSFRISLDPKDPATRAEVLDLFDWILALMVRFAHAPEEITRAVLFDAHGSRKAYFSLTFPGIAERHPDESLD
ncbi:MAG: hypothetical protein Q9226_005286 [Calogaya cf. arnoldii]